MYWGANSTLDPTQAIFPNLFICPPECRISRLGPLSVRQRESIYHQQIWDRAGLGLCLWAVAVELIATWPAREGTSVGCWPVLPWTQSVYNVVSMTGRDIYSQPLLFVQKEMVRILTYLPKEPNRAKNQTYTDGIWAKNAPSLSKAWEWG